VCKAAIHSISFFQQLKDKFLYESESLSLILSKVIVSFIAALSEFALLS
jgi:hypothetical protein